MFKRKTLGSKFSGLAYFARQSITYPLPLIDFLEIYFFHFKTIIPMVLQTKSRLTMVQLFCLLLISTLSFTSCEKEPIINQSNSLNKIMPLGASRVEGDRPNYESFRYALWEQLVAGAWDFDFIGTLQDEASYPNGQFDIDHEGRGGWTSGQILSEVESWIQQTGAPDIVLFSSPGGNDALTGVDYNQMISNVNSIIDVIQKANPNVTILIEQLAPGKTSIMTPTFANYLLQIQQDLVSIASQQSTASSQVIPIDMYTGFSDVHLADDVHYNEAGAKLIADRYYTVLKDILKQ